jgi:glycosyltransferase involved in cell wall biosynthesis
MSTRVLFVGGEDHYLRLPFILAMRRQGFHVVAAGSGDPAPFNAEGIDFLPFHFDRFMNPVSDALAIHRLAKIVRDLRPDIAQGYDTKPCLFLPLAARATSTRTVRTICGRAWVYSSSSPLALASRPLYRVMHRLASWYTAATVFEIGDDLKFFEASGMVGRNGILIPAGGGGVDVAGFEAALASSPGRNEIREELGLDEAEVVITVTRMTRQKGIPALLQAAAMVHRCRPRVRFLLVGPRESEGALAVSGEEIRSHAPYVMEIGPRRDVPALLRAADLFAFPTEYREGVPRVLLEASLAGLPIVSTSMPGCCEVLRDRWNGLLVPPGSPEAMASAILDSLSDRDGGKVMAARAAQITRDRFSLDAIAHHHARLYSTLIEASTRSGWRASGSLVSPNG